MQLIVGLGNPGPRYRETRHNAGFLVVDEVAHRLGGRWSARREADWCSVDGLTLLKPLTFMNLSGTAVQAALTRLRIPPTEMLVVHDDIDLPLGRLRYRRGGGAGGQRGVGDIIDRLGADFARLKIGVSRPPPAWTTEHWVLSRFQADEHPLLARVIDHAANSLVRLRTEGWDQTVNWANSLNLATPEPEPPPKPAP
jgi:PTH1 family peptidyl-tRNA hydrolase